MKTINLKEILRNSNVHVEFLKELVIPDGNNGTELDRVIDAMKEACKQTLELAAENAIVKKKMIRTYIVNKQSILDTINQVK